MIAVILVLLIIVGLIWCGGRFLSLNETGCQCKYPDSMVGCPDVCERCGGRIG